MAVLVSTWTGIAQAPAPTFEGIDSSSWGERLRTHDRVAQARLAAGGAASLAVLRILLAHPEQSIASAAAHVCRDIGPAAMPLAPDLLRGLRAASSWWTQFECGQALAALGAADDEVIESLLHHITQSDVPRLRQECLSAFAALRPLAAKEVLAASWRGEFAEPGYAVDALEWLGDRATDLLVDAVRNAKPACDVAREVLLRRGWLDVPELERAGLRELAEQALFVGPLHRLEFGELYRAERRAPPPVVDRLPTIEWASSYGHGSGMALCRAVAEDRGLLVTSIALREPQGGPAHVVVRTAVLSRDVAMALARQLALLPGILLQPKVAPDPDVFESRFSSNNFLAVARMALAERVVVDVAFADYPTHGNFAERFVAEIACKTLAEAMHALDWQPRSATDDDRAFVTAIGARLPKQAGWWTAERLKRLRDLLSPR